MYLKIHESSGKKVIAFCDKELLGKRFEQGQLQLEVHKDFYEGSKADENEIVNLLEKLNKKKEDFSFNVVGSKAVKLIIKLKLVDKNNILLIDKIPHALVL